MENLGGVIPKPDASQKTPSPEPSPEPTPEEPEEESEESEVELDNVGVIGSKIYRNSYCVF